MLDIEKHEEDAEMIKYLITNLKYYKYIPVNKNIIHFKSQSKIINHKIKINELDLYIGINDDDNDFINNELIYIKITAYLYTFNELLYMIDNEKINDFYNDFINDNDNIIKDNLLFFNILKIDYFNSINSIDDKKTKIFLINYFRILKILDTNEIYKNEWTTIYSKYYFSY